MGLPKFKIKISVEDYPDSEQVSRFRRKYVNGVFFARPGAGDNHNRINRNLIRLLSTHSANSEGGTFLDHSFL